MNTEAIGFNPSALSPQAGLTQPNDLVKKKRGRPKGSGAGKGFVCPAMFVDTVFESEHYASPVVIHKDRLTPKELLEETSMVRPKCLEGMVEMQTTKRPRLDLEGTETSEGGIRQFLIGPESPEGKPGWYRRMPNGTLHPDNSDGLYETESTYNLKDERQRDAKERNNHAIAAKVRQLVAKSGYILRKNFYLGRPFQVGKHMVFVGINPRGILTVLPIDYTQTGARKLQDKDVYRVLETWGNLVGLCFDTYKQRICTEEGELKEQKRNALHQVLGNQWNINIPKDSVKTALPALAHLTQINSLTQEMVDLETAYKEGRLQAVDHRTLATDYLRVKGTDEEISLYNKMLEIWVEGMVVRALFPGANFRYCLILTGAQQSGKTAFFSYLATAEHLTTLKGLNASDTSSSSITHNDIQRRLSTNNVACINEIGSVFRRIDPEDFKDFLDATTVEFTPKYMNDAVKQFRTTVMCGTNNSDEVLVDETGSTRFWFIPIGLTRAEPLDFDKLIENRNGIVASAIASVRKKIANDPTIIDALGLPKEMQDLSEALNKGRTKYNSYLDPIENQVRLTFDPTNPEKPTSQWTYVNLKEIQAACDLDSADLNSRNIMSDIEVALHSLGYQVLSKRMALPNNPKVRTKVYSLDGVPMDKDVYIKEREQAEANSDY